MEKDRKRTLFRNLLVLGLTLLFATSPLAHDRADDDDHPSVAGAVFVGTNHNNTHPTAPAGEPANQVIMYQRAHDGTLSFVGRFDTGGQGSGPSIRFAGDGLGSSRSLQLSQDNRWLFVANAASNSISVFRVSKKKLELTDVEPSNGVFPNSIAQHGNLVYVLHSAGAGNITGFRLSHHGRLTPIANSTRSLHANQDPVRPDTLFNPTQVSFTPDGRQLVVTIKDGPAAGRIPGVIPTGPGRVLVFNIDRHGRPSDDFVQTDLDNYGPFGFSFDRHGNVLIALFVGGPEAAPPITAAVGSFKINTDGSLVDITPRVFDGALDTCWLENNGKYAYGANYGSGTISSFRIGQGGQLRLLDSQAGLTAQPGNTQGSTPLDLAMSRNGRYLYNVLPGSGKVAAWRINASGSLAELGEYEITIVNDAGPRLLNTIDGDVAMCEVSPGNLVPCEFGPGGSPAGIAAF